METTWGTPVAANQQFGIDTNIESYSVEKTLERSKGIGRRESCFIKKGKITRMISVSFDVTDASPAWVVAVFNKTTGTPSNLWSADATPASLTIKRSVSTGTGATVETFSGCMARTLSFSSSEDEMGLRATLEFEVKDHNTTTGTELEYTCTGSPLLFTDAIFKIDTTSYPLVNSFTADVTSNVTYKYGTSAAPQARGVGMNEYTLSFDHYLTDTQGMQALADEEDELTGVVEFTGANGSKFLINFAGASFATYDTSNIDDSDVIESVTLWPKSLTIGYTAGT